MKNKYIFMIAIILFSALFTGDREAIGQERTEDKQIETISKVIQKFSELKSKDQLPVLKSQDSGGRLDAYQLKEKMYQKPWIDESMLIDIKKCNDLYVVDVELREKKLKYFFCIENSIIKLISTYIGQDDKWIKYSEQ